MPRTALYASIVLVLAIAAAVVSFIEGNWLGVVWILLAAVASNIAWFHIRRARLDRETAEKL